jgi:hypothetical protein
MLPYGSCRHPRDYGRGLSHFSGKDLKPFQVLCFSLGSGWWVRSGVVRDPLLHSERTQGFAADPDYWKGEVLAYVGSIQNLKDLKGEANCPSCGSLSCSLLQGYLAHEKTHPSLGPS